MRISIILPCYNAEKTIEDTLSSINHQIVKDFELVVINDGSTDGTLGIIKNFSFSERISLTIISRENKGFLKSLAEGISISKGDLIARIDADDIWEPEHLQICLKAFEDCNVVLVGTFASVINEHSREIGKLKMPTTDSDIRKGMLNDNKFIHSSVVFRKSAYDKTGGYLCGNDTMAMHIADYNLWVELSQYGQIRNIPEYSVRYRFLTDSMSRTVNLIANYEARRSVQKKAFSIYRQHHIYYLLCSIKVKLKILMLKLNANSKI